MRLIDADALKKKLIQSARSVKHMTLKVVMKCFAYCINQVDAAPTIDPVRHARWIENHCSECGMMPMGEEMWTNLDITPPKFEWFMDFCPICGAKMDGKENA